MGQGALAGSFTRFANVGGRCPPICPVRNPFASSAARTLGGTCCSSTSSQSCSSSSGSSAARSTTCTSPPTPSARSRPAVPPPRQHRHRPCRHWPPHPLVFLNLLRALSLPHEVQPHQ